MILATVAWAASIDQVLEHLIEVETHLRAVDVTATVLAGDALASDLEQLEEPVPAMLQARLVRAVGAARWVGGDTPGGAVLLTVALRHDAYLRYSSYDLPEDHPLLTLEPNAVVDPASLPRWARLPDRARYRALDTSPERVSYFEPTCSCLGRDRPPIRLLWTDPPPLFLGLRRVRYLGTEVTLRDSKGRPYQWECPRGCSAR